MREQTIIFSRLKTNQEIYLIYFDNLNFARRDSNIA